MSARVSKQAADTIHMSMACLSFIPPLDDQEVYTGVYRHFSGITQTMVEAHTDRALDTYGLLKRPPPL
jgi:hypothetical protein